MRGLSTPAALSTSVRRTPPHFAVEIAPCPQLVLLWHQSEHEVLSSNVNPPVKTSVFVRRREAMEVQESRASQSCVVDKLTQQEGNKHIP